jgi:acyl-CoA synthetase (NDP forming)
VIADNRGSLLLDPLLLQAFAVETTTARNVPEPFVKQLLSSLGITVPAGVTAALDLSASRAAADLHEPFALKAWGPGIVHKTELGAVRVGVARKDLDGEAAGLLTTVESHGVHAAGLYIEEMAPSGTEILFGLIARPPFGTLAILGSGGTDAELFDDVIVRLCPLSPDTAAQMLGGFRGASRLNGHRGAPPADRDALLSLVLALAGSGGLADLLGSSLAEFECNPIVVAAHGAVVADARLLLHEQRDTPADTVRRPFDPAALFTPRSVAVVGASTKRSAWGNRTLARYRNLGWTQRLFAVHPSGEHIDGVPTFTSLAAIPGGVDYAEISLPAEQCAAVLRSAGGKLKTAVVNSAGFAEAGVTGQVLQDELLAAAIEGGVRFVGPNCMGVFSPRGRQGYSGAVGQDRGSVGAVLQSGGLSTDLIQAGSACGLTFSAVVSIGNAADVGLGDLLDYLLADPHTETIAVHVEGGADERLIATLKRAAGHKPVVLLVPGLSTAGSKVAASHTGNLTSDRRGWEAMSEATGLALTETFEDFLATLVFIDRYRLVTTADDDAVLILGLGGGASVLAADACDAHRLRVPSLSRALQQELADKKGGIWSNPLDLRMGPAGPPSAPREALELVLKAHPFPDVMLHVDALTYANSTVPGRLPGLQHLALMLQSLRAASWPATRLALVVRNLTHVPGHYRDEIRGLTLQAGVPMFERFGDAAAAMAAAKRFAMKRNGLL